MTLAISDMLEEAIAMRGALTLTPLDVESAKPEAAKFLSLETDGGIWVQPSKSNETLARHWVSHRSPLQAQFYDRKARYSFLTHLIRRKPDYWLTDTVAIEAWLLEVSADLQTIQQRILPRFRVTESKVNLQGKLVLVGGKPGAQRAGEVVATLVDLSAGGACFVCPKVPALLQVRPRTVLYETAIQFGTRKVCLNGFLVHARAISAQSMRIGIEFLPPDQQPDQAMTHLDTLLKTLDPQIIWRPK